VVLLHGGPGSFDHSYFKPDFARLGQVAQVVYLDLRDHGRSAWGDPASWGFELAADDVRGFCGALGIARPVVYGHSLGGFVAMVYAARHPGHAGTLVLQSTMARFDLGRLVEGFRRAGGDEVAAIAERVYGGDSLGVTTEEWTRCWRLFGPWVLGDQERARTIVNRELNPPGLELMRGSTPSTGWPPSTARRWSASGNWTPSPRWPPPASSSPPSPGGWRGWRWSRKPGTSPGRTRPIATGRSSSSSSPTPACLGISRLSIVPIKTNNWTDSHRAT
jgi:pimeloyl-ACP methyl ester carboxylesterase